MKDYAVKVAEALSPWGIIQGESIEDAARRFFEQERTTKPLIVRELGEEHLFSAKFETTVVLTPLEKR